MARATQSFTTLPRAHGVRLHRRRLARQSALALLWFLVLLMPQLLGGVYAWSLLVGAPLALTILILTLYGTWSEEEPTTSSLAITSIFGITAWTAIQLIPLPEVWVGALAPEYVESARELRGLLGQPESASLPMTQDPGATRVELVQWLTQLAVLITAWIFSARGQRRAVVYAVASSAGLMATVALAHTALGVEALFGVYQPTEADPHVLAPLLNDNNLAGFMAMGLPALLTLGAREHGSLARRYACFVGATLTTIVGFLTLSRGGIVVLVLGGLVTAAWLALHRHRSQRLAPAQAIGGLLCFGLLAVGLWYSLEPVLREYHVGGVDKFLKIRDSLVFALDAPHWGVGRGAFSATYAQEGATLLRAEYPENLIAQWGAEWGLPATLLLLACLTASWWRAAGDTMSRTRLAALTGLAVIGLHNMVDYGLELPGVGIVAAALGGAALSPRSRRGESTPASVAPPLRVRNLGVASCLGLMFSLTLWAPSLNAESHPVQLDRFSSALAENEPIALPELHRAALLHPLEPTYPLFIGAQLTGEGDPEALAWLSRAMRLAPGWASPHVQAAWFLAGTGRWSQALLEIRSAAERDPESTGDLLCYLLGRHPRADWAARAAPLQPPARTQVLQRAARCLRGHDDAVAYVDRLILQVDAGDVDASIRSAMTMLEREEHQTALDLLAPILSRPGAPARAHGARAYILIERGDGRAALSELSSLNTQEFSLFDQRELLTWRARAAAAAEDSQAMRQSMNELRGLARASLEELERVGVLRHHLELDLGHPREAYEALEGAYRVRRSAPILLRAQALARAEGDISRAARYHQTLCRRHPGHPDYCPAEPENTPVGEPSEASGQPSGTRAQ